MREIQFTAQTGSVVLNMDIKDVLENGAIAAMLMGNAALARRSAELETVN